MRNPPRGGRLTTPEPPPGPPVLVQVTVEELAGAGRVVAGLTVLERSVKQLRRLGHKVVVATTVDLPPLRAPLPTDVEIRHAHDLGEIESWRSSSRALVAADVVRPSNKDPLDGGGRRVTDEASRRAAEDAIFGELLRGDLGFVARHLNKPISFRITRYLLCRLPFTPNDVTISAGLVGLCGAALVALGRSWSLPLGLFLAHLQSVLDGCDGELARVRFQQSDIGEWLDTLVDDALNFSLTVALGVGVWRLTGRPLGLWAGLAGGAMLLTYNAVAYRELVRQGEGGEVLKVRWWFTGGREIKQLLARTGRPTLKDRVLAIGRRDFFVLCWFLLALAGLAPIALFYAFVLAAINFTVAAGQVVWRAGRGRA